MRRLELQPPHTHKRLELPGATRSQGTEPTKKNPRAERRVLVIQLKLVTTYCSITGISKLVKSV